MRTRLLGTIAALAASAALAHAQPPAPAPATGPAIAAPAGPTGPGGLPMATGPMPYLDGPSAPPGLLSGYMGDTSGAAGLSSERGWTTFEYVLYFMRTMPATPLITSGTTAAGGTLPNLGTTTLFGAENFNMNPLQGMRWENGIWFKKFPLWGFSWGGFVTDERSDFYRVAGTNSVIARPFIDADTGTPNSFLVAFPGFLEGDITARVRSQIWGLDFDFNRKLLADETRRLMFRFGFRWIDLKEDLAVQSESTVLPGNTTNFYNLIVGAGSRIDVNDRFDTRNQFMLVDLGFQGDWRYRRWLVEWYTKFGLGAVRQSLDIEGNSQLITTPGAAPNIVQGGLLALDSNIGHFFGGRFAFVPEGKISVSYRMFDCMYWGFAYTFTYFNRVIRPSEQIDQQVSTTRLPSSANYGFPIGAFRPAVLFNESDTWLQSVSFNVSFRY
jgi:hypothetical protein